MEEDEEEHPYRAAKYLKDLGVVFPSQANYQAKRSESNPLKKKGNKSETGAYLMGMAASVDIRKKRKAVDSLGIESMAPSTEPRKYGKGKATMLERARELEKAQKVANLKVGGV